MAPRTLMEMSICHFPCKSNIPYPGKSQQRNEIWNLIGQAHALVCCLLNLRLERMFVPNCSHTFLHQSLLQEPFLLISDTISRGIQDKKIFFSLSIQNIFRLFRICSQVQQTLYVPIYVFCTTTQVFWNRCLKKGK